MKGSKVSSFNQSENSKGVKVKPLIDQNNFAEENKGIKVNPLNYVKVASRKKCPDKLGLDYMKKV